MSKNRLEHYKTIKPQLAIKLQKKLRSQISLTALDSFPKLVGGADISFNLGSKVMHAAIIVLKLPELRIVARSLASDETTFPYIPGLLAFREMPVLLKAWEQLKLKPELLILDGHGLAHPRRLGIATHLGIELNLPTIGCAKNILVGTHDDLPNEKGSYVNLMHEEEKIGMVLRSRTSVNPIYISPGHKVSFEDTYRIVLKTLTKFKYPRTSRLAHSWANKLRKGVVEPGVKIFDAEY